MINIFENHCIQAIAYKAFLICLSKCTRCITTIKLLKSSIRMRNIKLMFLCLKRYNKNDV